jgi:hypothetical protein
MMQQVKKLLHALPFVPFKIRTSDGREYVVPTSEHALVAPNNTSVSVYDDEGLVTIISGLHIASVESTGAMA